MPKPKITLTPKPKDTITLTPKPRSRPRRIRPSRVG